MSKSRKKNTRFLILILPTIVALAMGICLRRPDKLVPVPRIGSIVIINDPNSIYHDCTGRLIPLENQLYGIYIVNHLTCPKLVPEYKKSDWVKIEENELKYLEEY